MGLGLSLEQVGTGPDFGPVLAPRPDAGSVVDAGSTVTARVEAVADPPVLVTVRTVIGLEPAEVGRTLDASGLVLSSTTAGGAVVAVEQSPAAGSRVERGSQVIVQFGPTVPPSTAATSTAGPVPGGSSPAGSQSPVSSQSDATVLWLAVLAAALAATAVVGVRRARVRRHPGSQRPDVRGHPSPGTPILTELGPPVRTRLRLVPHQDRGTQTFEEARHD